MNPSSDESGPHRFKPRAWLFSCLVAAVIAAICLHAPTAGATVYEVGPGKTYANINDVPLEDLAGGDTLKIYYRSTPYKEKWVMCAPATESNPLVVEGVPDEGGNLPVIDGEDATTREETNYWGGARNIIKIGGSNIPYCHIDEGSPRPSYIMIKNLEIKNARPGIWFTGRDGLDEYWPMAACVQIEIGDHITLRDCIFHNTGNGVTTSHDSSEIVIEGCHIYDCGNVGSLYEHQTYTESQGIIYQYNHMGPLLEGASGNNIKDRSAGTVVRYNLLHNGNRELDLIDSEYQHIRDDSRYGKDFVYGNVIIEDNGDYGRQICHYGGDSGVTSRYRLGPLEFYNNTIISYRDNYTMIFRPQLATCDINYWNNIAYCPNHSAGDLHIREQLGTIWCANNWFPTGYNTSNIDDGGGNITGTDPGFVDFQNQDFHLDSGSDCIDAGRSLPSNCLPLYDVNYQYVETADHESRPSDGSIDIGAYEYGTTADLTIDTTDIDDGLLGEAYSDHVHAYGGVKPYTWSIYSGSLPGGWSLDADTGLIEGTATEHGSFNFTVQVTDSAGTPDTDTQAISVEVTIPDLVVTTTSLNDGYVNVAYCETLSATGGLTPYTWSVQSGSLPAGLSLNSSTGVISGTPTSSGNNNFTVRCTDNQGTPDTDDQALSITISTLAALDITTTTLDTGYVAVAYSNTLEAAGGWAPYTWSIDSGSLPAGLSLNSSTGEISGTPTSTGVSNFTVKVEDSQVSPASDAQALSITVTLAPLDITTTSIPGAKLNESYSTTIEAQGGQTPFTWTIDSGSLPNGLSLNSSTGVISGTPTETGSFPITVKVEDSQEPPASDTQEFGFGVDRIESGDGYAFAQSAYESSFDDTYFHTKVTLDWTPDAVDDWVIIASGEVYGGVTWADVLTSMVLDGSDEFARTFHRPAGYEDWFRFTSIYEVENLSASRHTIDYKFRVMHEDGTAKCRNVVIMALRKADLEIHYGSAYDSGNTTLTDDYATYASTTFTPDTAGDYLLCFSCEHIAKTDYSNYIQAKVDSTVLDQSEIRQRRYTDTYSWASFKIVNLDATQHTVKLDAKKEPGGTASHVIRRVRVMAIRLTGSRLSDYASEVSDSESSTSQTTYQQKLTKTWNNPVDGSDWLFLVSGDIKGTSDAVPTDVRAQLNNTTTFLEQSREEHYTADWLNFAGLGVATLSSGNNTVDVDYRTGDAAQTAYIKYVHFNAIRFDAPIPLSILTEELDDALVDSAYSDTLEAEGGVTPLTWSIDSGSLPSGLSLNSSTGVISGTPTATGTSNFTVKVEDSQATADSDTKALSIVVTDAVNVTTTSLPDATLNSAYSEGLSATGGITPYTWSVDSGSLPNGLSLSSAGVLSGTPTEHGTFNFTVKAADSASFDNSDTQPLSLDVNIGDLVITTTSLPDGQDKEPYAEVLLYSGGLPPVTWSLVSGSLPSGLSLASTGLLSGTLAEYGDFNFTVRATDNQGTPDTDDQALSLHVEPAPVSITKASLSDGEDGVSYSDTLTASGGVTPYTWSITTGALPSGLSLNSSTGAVTGTPTKPGVWVFTVKVEDSYTPTAQYATKEYRVEIEHADGPYFKYASSDDESTQATSTYQTKVTLTWTPEKAEDWLVIGFAELRHGSSTSGRQQARMQIDSTTCGEQSMNGYSSWPFLGEPVFFMKKTNLSAASHTVTIDWRDYSAAKESKIKNARIVALRKSDLDLEYTETDDTAVELDTTYAEVASLEFTPDSAGDYLVIACAEVFQDGGQKAKARVMNGETTLTEFDVTYASPDWQPIVYTDIISFDASEQTISIEGAEGQEKTGENMMRRCRIAAIRLDGRLADAVEGEATASDTTTSTTYVERLSKTWDAAQHEDWLLLASSALQTVGSQSYTTCVRYERNNSTVGEQDLAGHSDGGNYPEIYNNNWMSSGMMDVITDASGTEQFDIDYKRYNTTPTTAGIKDAHFVAVPLDALLRKVSITTTGLDDAVTGASYNQTLTCEDGNAPLAWSVVSGSLPTGLSLASSTGVISGTPTVAGVYDFTVRVTDEDSYTDDRALSISVYDDVNITTTTMPDASYGLMYNQYVSAEKGKAPYTWSIDSGSLPTGMSLDASSGLVSGECWSEGTWNFTVKVTDSASPANTDTQALSIEVVIADLEITTLTLPSGTSYEPYDEQLEFWGGVPPITWTLESGSLPTGLVLEGDSGRITGIPTSVGDYQFDIKATDSAGTPDTDQRTYTLEIVPADLVITTTELDEAIKGVAYSDTVEAFGGSAPYTWSVDSGSLPAGLSLNSSTGVISGTPTETGRPTFTIKVTDGQATPDSDTQVLDLKVNAGIYYYAEDNSVSDNTTTTYQTKTTLTFTPDSSDDFLVLAMAEVYGTYSGDYCTVRLQVDSTTYGEQTPGMTNDDISVSNGVFFVKKVTLDASEHTLTLDWKNSSDNEARHGYIRNARIIAVPQGAETWHYAETDDTEVDTTTSWSSACTLQFTPESAGDYLVLYSAELHPDGSYSAVEARAVENSNTLFQLFHSISGSTRWVPLLHASVISCDTSQQTLTIDAKEHIDDGSPKIRRCRIMAIRMTGGRFADTVEEEQSSEQTTSSETYVQKLTRSWSVGAHERWLLLPTAAVNITDRNYSILVKSELNDSTTIFDQDYNGNSSGGGYPDIYDNCYLTAGGFLPIRDVSTSQTVDVDIMVENDAETGKVRQMYFLAIPMD